MIKILNSANITKEEILCRVETPANVDGAVEEVLANVKANGDRALLEYTKKFDGAELESIEVTDAEMLEALATVDEKFVKILKQAAENIKNFHSRQVRGDFVTNDRPGVVLGQRVIPLARVGLYVPGGTASYPSTVLMNCIPAKLAGVGEIVMATPPKKDGKIPAEILAAASVAGVDRIFKMGGAQAVAAMAYGTESVPAVDKIVGPGNIFVATAKSKVRGIVDIDMIAGPSEILVVADEKSDPELVAADMLSQAEHDKLAASILITNSEALANAVSVELEKQIAELPRQEIARTSIDDHGRIIITDSIEKAVEISNLIAPEHLELCVDKPFDILSLVKNAGSVFLGRNTPESVGDYYAGTNHTLPTSGTARFSSPLSVDDFVKTTQFIYYSDDALKADGEGIAYFAEKEGLSAHARAVTKRMAK